MDVTPLVKDGAQIIQSYANGQFRISDTIFDGPVIVTPDRATKWDVTGEIQTWNESTFAPLLDDAQNIDVILLGCGATQQFLPQPLRNALKEKGLSIDAMDTGAACRTYNVLMAEGRRIAAALRPIQA